MNYIYRNHRHPLTPMDPPTDQAIMDACRVLTNQQLAVYQRLYAVGLTSPGSPAAPFEVQRSLTHLACLEVSLHQQYGASGYLFVIPPGADLESIVAKCERIITAVETNQQPVSPHACCPLATFRHCVCAISFQCELHGTKCYGTHD
mgnify:CR=1 FL=1